MTREAKVGLMMVALLVGVFGFLLYKRIHRPAEAFAGQKASDNERSVAADADFPPRLDDDLIPRRKKEPSRIGRDIENIERGAGKVVKGVERVATGTERLAVDAVEELNPFASENTRREKPRLPTQIPADDNEFAQFERTRGADGRTSRNQAPEVIDTPFGDAVEQLAPSRADATKSVDASTDPFADDVAETVRPVEFKDESRRNRPVPVPNELDDRTVVKQTRKAIEIMEVDIETETPRGAREADNRFDRTSREKRRPAPIEFTEDSSFAASPSPISGIAEPNRYVVQPNDNFWSISRKCYGAGRFYMALARHNRDVISDPKMMKPGVVISTPEVSVLEQRYSDVIPKAGPIDSGTSVSSTQTRNSASAESPGYFVANDGAPMYRVGDQDTLTLIAKSHLGRTSRWVQILEMNRNVLRDGNELKIGTVLRLPADASRVQVVGTMREYR